MLFTNLFYLFESSENSKKSSLRVRFIVLFRILVRIKKSFMSMFFILACVKFHVWACIICTNNKIGTSVWLRVIILQSPEKRVLWKFWFYSRFSRNSKSKWTLKWLPLDRGYFKFCFCKSKSILVISCRTYLWTFEFIISF